MRYILFILSSFLLFSCEEEYTVGSNEFTPSIVVTSVFTADSSWIVNLSTSRNVFDENSKSLPVEDAKVVIYERNGQLACQLEHHGNGEYRSITCTPSMEKNYRLSVSSSEYGNVMAYSSLPSKAIVKLNTIDSVGDKTIIDFSIEEQPSSNNYYIWDLVDVRIDNSQVVTEPTVEVGTRINMQNWIDDLTDDVYHIKSKKLSSQQSVASYSFDGNTFVTSIAADHSLITKPVEPNSTTGGGQVSNKVKTMLRVMTVSEELFQYYQSIEQYLAYDQYKVSFAEPATVYNNIENGIGIFAGYTVEYLEIK